MPGNGHDHRAYVFTIFSRVPTALAGLFGSQSRRGLYIWSFLFFGLPLWAIFHYGFFTTFPLSGPDTILYGTLYIAALWIWIGPLLICWWEQKYTAFLAEVCDRSGRCVAKSPETRRIVSYYKRTAKYWGLLVGVAGASMFGLYVPQIEPFAVLFGNPWMLVLSFIVTIMSGAMSGYGVAGAVQTIVLYRNLDRLSLRWDPLRGDEAGGFVFLGEFAVKTSVAFAVGTIILPAVLQVNRYVSNVSVWWAYFVTFSYSALIIGVSAVPIYFAVQAARRDREMCLGSLGERLRCIVDFRTPGGFESIRHDQPQIAWVDMLLNADGKVRAASILPFSPTSVAKVAILALLPFVSTAVRYIIQIL
jgi:hypothetical protein